MTTASPTRYISAADTAKLVRKELKQHFPGVKFSVRTSTYSGGASIHVSWTDGPRASDVDSKIRDYAGASFDGMADLKSYRHSFVDGERVHYGADFIFVQRRISDEARQAARDDLFRVSGMTLAEFDKLVDSQRFVYAPECVYQARRVGGDFPMSVWIDMWAEERANVSA